MTIPLRPTRLEPTSGRIPGPPPRPGLSPLRFGVPLLALLAVLAVVATAALLLGTEPISLQAALEEPTGLDAVIVFRLRLPRVAAATLLGAALAVSGAALQALLRNPLADPYVLGVSGGAAVGGSLAMAVGAGAAAAASADVARVAGSEPVAAAFVGALLATALTWRIGTVAGRVAVHHALLAGVVVNSFAAAVVMFLKTVVEARKAQEILLWLMGTLAVETVPRKTLVACLLVASMATAALLGTARGLNALALGDDEAARLGYAPGRIRLLVLLLASAAVGASVALAGMIGFVGLVVPHALRLVLGGDHRNLLPACALGGAALLVGCDLVSRALFPMLATETPVGAVTAFLGGPAFVGLLHRQTSAARGTGAPGRPGRHALGWGGMP